MDLENYLYKVKQQVEEELKSFFDHESKIARQNGGPYSQQALEFLKEYILRGKSKRLRACLMYIAYEMFGGKNKKAILKSAIASEFIQASLLIHDDIIDQDELRRGKPVMHRTVETWLRKKGIKGDLEHLGVSLSIVIGDIAILIAHKHIFSNHLKSQKVFKMLNNFYRSISDTSFGQIFDILLPYLKEHKINDVLRVCKLKTAKYTLENPLHMGAIAAGADLKDLKILSAYAIPTGIAFQLQDDILGMYGSSQQIGKQAGSDLEEGKVTLLILKTFELGSKNHKLIISKLLKKQKITKKDLELARKIIQDSGALDATQKYAEELIRQGKKALTKVKKVNPQYKELLFQLADYIIKRRY